VVSANLRFRLPQLETRIASVVQFHLDVGHSIYIFFSSALSELLHFRTDRWSETPEMKPSRIAELHLAEMKQRWNLSHFSKLQMFSAFG